MAGTPESVIDDVSCQKCGYNVRTLAVTARCPECAFPVLRSFIAFKAGARALAPLGSSLLARSAFLVLSRVLKRNVDSIHFVFRAYQHAQRQLLSDRDRFRADPEIHAADLCRGLAAFALEHYGDADDAIATLHFWRLDRSEDVGEIVAGLIEAGLMAPGEKDHPSDFDGLCDMTHLLKQYQ